MTKPDQIVTASKPNHPPCRFHVHVNVGLARPRWYAVSEIPSLNVKVEKLFCGEVAQKVKAIKDPVSHAAANPAKYG